MPHQGMILEGKYVLTRLIGEGGMGSVWEAQHQVIGRRVAVKFLLPEYTDNQQALQRFQQEARIAGNLGHPNICEVTDIGTADDGSPYMIMPLLKGLSLEEVLESEDQTVPADRALDIISQVLTALQRAHEEGIVHRDLKPANIFISSLGDRQDFVKILDFGISKVVQSEDGKVGSGLTVTGMILGTPYYMAPEQARGLTSVDFKVDIYAAGTILYELLTGKTPYQGESYNDIIIRIVTEGFPPPRAINPTISEAVEAVVLKAMAKDPTNRYDSATEFKHALIDAARQSSMPMPSHLGMPGFTGEISTVTSMDNVPGIPSRYGKGLWIGVGVGSLLAISAIAILVIKPWGTSKSTAHEKSQVSATAQSMASTSPGMNGTKSNTDAGVARSKGPATVTIEFDNLPKGARVTLAGKPAPKGKTTITRGTNPLSYVVEAQGYRVIRGTVVPDQNKAIPLLMSKLPKHRASRPRTRRGVYDRHRHVAIENNYDDN